MAQLPFIINFFWSIFKGEKVKNDNPWDATTIEWDTPSPPGHGNFVHEPACYRGPYEYSVPNAKKDFSPQFEETIEYVEQKAEQGQVPVKETI